MFYALNELTKQDLKKSKAGDLTLPTSPFFARFIHLDELKREAIFTSGHSKLVLPIWSRQRLAEVLKAGGSDEW